MPIIGTLAGASARGLGGLRTFGAAQTTAFESIATVSISTATSTVEFTNIPGTFAHLELRVLSVTNSAYNGARMEFNNDTTTTNYRSWYIYASGGGGNASSGGGGDVLYAPNFNGKGATTAPGPSIINIYDYAKTNKYKTVTVLDGGISGTDGYVAYTGGHWESTSAITSIKINLGGFTYSQYAHFALYGIKAA